MSSRKDVSAIVSGMGIGLSILQVFTAKAMELGVSDVVIHRLATPEGQKMLGIFAETLANTGIIAIRSRKIEIRPNESLAAKIPRASINRHYLDVPQKYLGVYQEDDSNAIVHVATLVNFGKPMLVEEALVRFDEMTFRPGTVLELADYMQYYHPDESEDVVALGDDDGLIGYGYLKMEAGSNQFFVGPHKGPCGSETWFLVFAK